MTAQKTQADLFQETAREVEADESNDALDRIMGKLDLTKKPEPNPSPQSSEQAA